VVFLKSAPVRSAEPRGWARCGSGRTRRLRGTPLRAHARRLSARHLKRRRVPSRSRFRPLRRASAISKSINKGTAWAKKLEQRAARQQVLHQQRTLNDEIATEKRAERERIEAKRKRREENRLRSGTRLQAISDPKKIKRMSKKQSKMIVMADTTGVAPVDKGAGVEVVAKPKRRSK
jgi:hypothetical protein